MSNHEYSTQPDRDWTRRMADAEDRCTGVLAGGLASDVGLLRSGDQMSPRVFGQLIEFARRSRGLTPEQLASNADIELSELVAIERDEDFVPTPRSVFNLARELRLAAGKLMELSGLAERRDQTLSQAALRFAARSEPSAKLTKAEREAFEEFVKVLVEASDGG